MDLDIFVNVLCDKGTRFPYNYSETHISETLLFVYLREISRLKGASLEEQSEAISLRTWEHLFERGSYPEPTWLYHASGSKPKEESDVSAFVSAPTNTSWMSRVEFLKIEMGAWHYFGLVSMGVLLSGLLGSSRMRNFVGQWVKWEFGR
ncbi:hypothetical protein BELL_0019g00180 [Botrytis elliptica]|uniref:Uncharacterized protein n=1 Tax=Botrytis elliptica TaxID=278938 RepID=A0A4Z1K794_9HELO|nr:hypothetical protein BELL_0019g00180 [Botrytis elliptica]